MCSSDLALLQVQRRGDCGSPRAVGSAMPSKAGARPGSLDVNACHPPPSWRIRPGATGAACNSSTPFGQRDARQAAGAADPRNATITQFHGLAGGHQAAGVFVQMRPPASKVLGELGIGVHAQRDNTSGW